MAYYNNIITPDEIEVLARPCTIDEEIAWRYIEEAEMQDVKPLVGDALFFDICDHPSKYEELLEGGICEIKGKKLGFGGLKRAVAYYVWARMVKCSVHHLTRFGFVNKNDDNSHAVEWKERQAAYNDAYAVADNYMKECLAYIKDKSIAQVGEVSQISKKRTFLKTIGE